MKQTKLEERLFKVNEELLRTIRKLTGKQDAIADLDTIRSGAAAGSTAYQKPTTGIPKTDLSNNVTSDIAADVEGALEKAETVSLAGVKMTKSTLSITDEEGNELTISSTGVSVYSKKLGLLSTLAADGVVTTKK